MEKSRSNEVDGSRWMPAALATTLLVVELIIIGVIFKSAIPFRCLDNWPQSVCSGISTGMVGVYCAMAGVALLAALRPLPFENLMSLAGQSTKSLWLNGSGVLVALVPVLFMQDGVGAGAILPAVAFWSIGLAFMLVGVARFLAPAALWKPFLQSQWKVLLPIVAVGFFTPFLAKMIRPIWRLDGVADLTFNAVAWVVRLLGYNAETFPDNKIIGADGFFINVAPQCSGVEGLALVTLFVTLYLSLFKGQLKFPRAFLLYPIGLVASAIFNVLRVAFLLIIGLEGNPELAVGGFHSHAGWLMFIIVALGIVFLANAMPVFQKTPSEAKCTPVALPPFTEDPTVARILPFLIFMVAALLASTFFQNPSVVYPLRVLIVAAAMVPFVPLYRRLDWSPGALAIGVGVAIGVFWVAIPYNADEGPLPYGELAGGLLVLWFVFRAIGTILLVPVLEELFFRDYLPKRLTFGEAAYWPFVGMLISAVAFAALHGRWAEAFVAALVFQLVYQRTGRITDAIVAHAVANAIVYGFALATNQLHII